jgi:hypothetical protein
VAYNFQTENNKMKLLMEYENATQTNFINKIDLLTEHESVIQKVLLPVEQNFLSCVFIFHKQFHFIASGLKIIRHGNLDNNLESLYISKLLCIEVLFTVLFPGFLLRSRFIASTDVVMYQTVLS